MSQPRSCHHQPVFSHRRRGFFRAAALCPGAAQAPGGGWTRGTGRSRGRSLLVRVFLVLLLFFPLSSFVPAAVSSPGPSEYDVKAAFVGNFARFVQWPASVHKNDQEPLIVGVLGVDPFGRSLDDALADQEGDAPTFSIRRSNNLDDLRGCQILFISSSEKVRMTQIAQALQEMPVLLIGDDEEMVEKGCHIGFLMEKNRIRFTIDVEAANLAGLKLSAKLLALAKRVSREPGEHP
jgi:hypothetical protein